MPSYRPQYRLTVYAPRATDVTEATVLTPAAGAAHSDPFRVTTHPSLAGWKPYLMVLPGRRGRIDPLKKTVDVGEFTFTLLDTRNVAGGSNLSRWLTAFLGDPSGNPLWMALKLYAEESLDNGVTWASFLTGRVQSAKLSGNQRFDIVTRDLAQDMRYRVFVGRPQANASGSLYSILPIGLAKNYGSMQKVAPLTGSDLWHLAVPYQGRTVTVATILLDAASGHRAENLFTQNLANELGYYFIISGQAAPLGPDHTPIRNRVPMTLKRLGTRASGEFYVGSYGTTRLERGGTIRQITGLGISELTPPLGVATGTPLVNNAAGYVIGATSIATDGWTINITGIVKKGDLVKFAGHAKHYTAQADANSNGSGQATFTIAPGLSVAVVDNEALSIVGEPGFMKMPPDNQTVELSVVVDGPITKKNPLLVDDVHPVQFWKDLLDGFYSRIWKLDDLPPTGQSPGDPQRSFPYDATKFATLIADATFPKIRLL